MTPRAYPAKHRTTLCELKASRMASTEARRVESFLRLRPVTVEHQEVRAMTHATPRACRLNGMAGDEPQALLTWPDAR